MADLIIDVYQGSNRKCLAIGNHRISVGKAYGFLEKVESYKCDTKDILSCIGNENRWISCSERLPEKSGLYLTYQKELGRFQLMRYSPVLRNGTGWFDDNYGLYVTHWMPLPEPPEKE